MHSPEELAEKSLRMASHGEDAFWSGVWTEKLRKIQFLQNWSSTFCFNLYCNIFLNQFQRRVAEILSEKLNKSISFPSDCSLTIKFHNYPRDLHLFFAIEIDTEIVQKCVMQNTGRVDSSFTNSLTHHHAFLFSATAIHHDYIFNCITGAFQTCLCCTAVAPHGLLTQTRSLQLLLV